MAATHYTESRNFIVPSAMREALNTSLMRLGYGPDTFSIACNASGNINRTITHYGTSWTMKPADLTVLRELLSRAGVAEYSGNSTVETFHDTAVRAAGVQRAV